MDQRLDWIDAFVERIKPYVYVREPDRLLIVRPNQAYKLNPRGVDLLGRLLQGTALADVVPVDHLDVQQIDDLYRFFTDVCACVKGVMGEGRPDQRIQYQRPYNTLPVLSEVAVTYRCNLRCRFCYAACGCSRSSTPDDLDTAHWKRLLEVIYRDARVPSTSFTGGEPLLRDDLEELITHARHLGMRVNLITNGTLDTPDRVASLVAAGLNSVQVSVEAATPNLHDELVAVAGSWERTTDAVRTFKSAGIHVHTNTTLNRLNAVEAEAIVELVKQLGLDRFSMNMVIPCGTATANLDDLVIRYDAIGDVVCRVHRHARRLGLEFMWYSPTPYCLFNPIGQGLGGKSCAVCDGLLSIDPRGNVLPCSSWPEPVGNLLTEPFDRVWQCARSRFLRERQDAPARCHQCDDFLACGGACPIYWRAMGTDEVQPIRRDDELFEDQPDPPGDEPVSTVHGSTHDG